jgi:hypothetical protein
MSFTHLFPDILGNNLTTLVFICIKHLFINIKISIIIHINMLYVD